MRGTDFFKMVTTWHWKERDSAAVELILSGDVAKFLQRFVRIRTSISDSVTCKRVNALYYVAPDYLGIGTDDDWVRVPLTPNAAQKIADSLLCLLPTRKMVDDIYVQAKVKLEPVPCRPFETAVSPCGSIT